MTSDAPVDLLQDGILRIEVTSVVPPVAVVAPQPRPAPTGTCVRCNERPAAHRCFQCERWVCKDDHWIMLGLCKDCATTTDNRAARERSPTARPDLGIKWIED